MNRQTLRLYWNEVRHHKRTFFTMLVFIPLGAATIDSLLPYLLSQAIGEISQSKTDGIASLLWLAVAAGVTGAVLNYVGFRAMVHHEGHLIRMLRERVFETLMSKDHAFFVDQKIGAMTSKYIDYVRSYVVIQDLFIIRTLSFVLTVGSGLVILSLQSPLVAAIVAGLIVLLSFEIRWSAKLRAPLRHERKTLVSEIHGSVADALTNNLIVRSYAGEEKEIAALHKLTSRFTTVYIRDIGFVMTEGSLRVLLMVLVQVATIVLSVNMIANGTMDIAGAIFVLAYMQRIGSQLFVLGDIINGYDQAFLDAQPMTEMLLRDNRVNESKRPLTLTGTSFDIELRDVSYRYDDGNQDVLSNISLTIPYGQKVGVVGHSGAGKSTIVQLLLRFSDVTDGAILLNGNDIRHIKQSSLRSNIAYVPQEPLLFHRTLRENIAYANATASEKAVTAAAKKAHALEFIRTMPEGLDTIVGERGVKLSGGQRQRIAIARAILKDAPILLLDEATSALDSESEKLIQASLDGLMKGRTSIVIAHRLSTIAKLDRIIVIDNGAIAEDGTHAELLELGGIYANLWSHQSGGFIED